MAKPQKISLYRPHRRIQEHGELVNAYSGEVIIPPSMTKQEFCREADINNIIKQYKTAEMARVAYGNAKVGRYEDLPDAIDFQESLHTIKVAESAFMTLPSKVRDRFGQDPAQFLAFISDPDNADEARKLGILKPLEAAPPPIKVEVTNPEKPAEPPKA